MIRTKKQSGFTAVELLITLFVAAAFLIAAYQLFNLVIKDGGATRAESRASNVAYDYLRKYASSATTIPCTKSSPLSDDDITVDGLTNATVSVDVTCGTGDAPASLSRVTSSVTYNVPQKTVSYTTFVSSTGNTGIADITDGLNAWFKLDGDTTTAVGSPNGTTTTATSTSHNGIQDTAYSFNGTNAVISAPTTYAMRNTNVTISAWIWNPTATNSGMFVNVGNGVNSGYGIGIGSTRADNATPGTKLMLLYENVRWVATTTDVGTGWHHVVMEIDGSGNPSAYLDGVAATGVTTGNPPATPTGMTTIGASPGSVDGRYFKGSVDDVRLYNRKLSLAEIITLYTNGAQ